METKLTFLLVGTPDHFSKGEVNAHIIDENGDLLCRTNATGHPGLPVTWDRLLHENPYGCICKRCHAAALLRIRPKARFWYLDPFHGNEKSFGSLRGAVSSAKKEHGNSTIWQTGPGDINKIIRFVEGLPVLP